MFILGVQIDTIQTVPMTAAELNAASSSHAVHGDQIEIPDTLEIPEDHL